MSSTWDRPGSAPASRSTASRRYSRGERARGCWVRTSSVRACSGCTSAPYPRIPGRHSDRDDRAMRAEHAALVDRLRDTRWLPLLRLIDDAGVDDGPVPAADSDAVEPYRWLLTRIGDGIRLTSAGYLPPAVVEETMRALGWDADWIGKMNREDQTYPVWELREFARRTGLVRKHRGVLQRTVAGRRLTDDAAGLWEHLAGSLPLARAEVEREAGVLFLLAVAAGRPRPHAVVAEGLGALGLVDTATGRPPTEQDALDLARDTWAVFRQLGLIPRRSGDDAPTTAGAVQLARAAL